MFLSHERNLTLARLGIKLNRKQEPLGTGKESQFPLQWFMKNGGYIMNNIENKKWLHISRETSWKIGNKIVAGEEFNEFWKGCKTFSPTIEGISCCDLINVPDEDWNKLFKPTLLAKGLKTVSKEFALYKREQVFEQVRKEQFNDLPSRQKCIWLTDEENLEYWKTMSTEEKCLLTLELQEEKMICCDESWLYIDTFLDDEYERRARNYWTGSVSNAPHLEYLFYGTAIVKNIERI